MGNEVRSGLKDRDNWRIRLTTGLSVAVCMSVTFWLGPIVGINGFWPGMLAVLASILAGIFLGRFVGGVLFRPSSS